MANPASLSNACGTCQTSAATTELQKNITSLPDPFTFVDGRPVKDACDWTCRKDEIAHLFQKYELGTKPPKIPNISATFTKSNSTGTLTITLTNSNHTITISPKITYPSTGSPPYPALIGVGGISIPSPSNAALITFDNSAFAQQTSNSSRGRGLFFTLYPDSTAGALIAWSWGISRLIDALEITPSAQIDTTRLGVTGCSRNGKGALVAGAFDDRIALTVPQESGSGGAGCWRVSDEMFARGQDTQTAHEIVRENVWFAEEFTPFASTSVLPLPIDHHLLAGMVAPRGLLVVENSDYLWLGPESTFRCMGAGRTIYEALGVGDRMGFSEVGGHAHCSFPKEKQGSQLQRFYDRFLFGRNASTDVFETDQVFAQGNQTWVTWKTPILR